MEPEQDEEHSSELSAGPRLVRRAPIGGRPVRNSSEKGVRTQEGKKGIHMLETVGMGCWNPSGEKKVSMCCDSNRRFVYSGALIK